METTLENRIEKFDRFLRETPRKELEEIFSDNYTPSDKDISVDKYIESINPELYKEIISKDY